MKIGELLLEEDLGAISRVSSSQILQSFPKPLHVSLRLALPSLNGLSRQFSPGMASAQGSRSGVAFTPKDFSPLGSKLPTSSPNVSPIGSSPSSPQMASASYSNGFGPSPVGPASNVGSATLHAAPPLVAFNGEVKSSWSSLFHTGISAQLCYHHLLVANGKHSIFISKSVHNLGISVWENCLVGQFLRFVPSL